MINEVIRTVCMLMLILMLTLVSPATCAAGERSFSTARRLTLASFNSDPRTIKQPDDFKQS